MFNPSLKLEDKLIPQEEEVFCRGLSFSGLLPQSSFLCQHYQTADCKSQSKGRTTPGVDFQNLQKKKLFQKALICVTEKQRETICFCSRGGHVKMHQVSCQQPHNIKHCFNSSNYKGSFLIRIVSQFRGTSTSRKIKPVAIWNTVTCMLPNTDSKQIPQLTAHPSGSLAMLLCLEVIPQQGTLLGTYGQNKKKMTQLCHTLLSKTGTSLYTIFS